MSREQCSSRNNLQSVLIDTSLKMKFKITSITSSNKNNQIQVYFLRILENKWGYCSNYAKRFLCFFLRRSM